MTDVRDRTITAGAHTWSAPSPWLGAAVSTVVVVGFMLVHEVLIVDIWWNSGPMLISGALCGFCLTWSYRRTTGDHSTRAWLLHGAMHAAEMAALGGASIVILQPRFTMAELSRTEDDMALLVPPSLPLLVGAVLLGTLLLWIHHDRRPGSLGPILLTQVLLVFLLGHQLAFLGVVESSSALMLAYAEFVLFVAGIAAAFCFGVMWSTIVLDRPRRN